MIKTLAEIIRDAAARKVAVGHFNISDLVAFKAITEAAQELSVPVIIGTSESEAHFVDRKEITAMVKALREESGVPVFLNSDHTHAFEEVKAAVEAGYDAVLFDAGKLPLEENIRKTKEAVEYIKSKNPAILVEGEIGYIGSSSQILQEIPAGAAMRPEDLTTPEQAAYFVRETGVDLLAPAVGNIHGMIGVGKDPDLDIARIAAIRGAAGVPLVLHGGSGNTDADFLAAINAGVAIIHINTEIRVAWREGMERGLHNHPQEIAPYKILPEAVEAVKGVVRERLKLFNKLI